MLRSGGRKGDLRPATEETGEALLELLVLLVLDAKGNLMDDTEFALRARVSTGIEIVGSHFHKTYRVR